MTPHSRRDFRGGGAGHQVSGKHPAVDRRHDLLQHDVDCARALGSGARHAPGRGHALRDGEFRDRERVEGTVQGTLTGSLDNGFFDGSLTASSAGRTSEQRYSGPITTASAALAPGECVQGTCAADGLTGAIQTVQTPTPNGPPPPPCSYALSPTNASVPAAVARAATTVTTSPNCAWAAISTAPWITIVGAAAGTGAARSRSAVQANPGDQRSGSLRIADQTLTVIRGRGSGGPGPTITAQPQSQTIASGQTATLSVAATGTAPLSYQWYVGPSGTTTTPIARGDGEQLHDAGADQHDELLGAGDERERQRRLEHRDDHGHRRHAPPTITTQPQSQTIASGQTATLSVAATGTAPLRYQWYVGPSGTTTTPIAGATASSYTTPALTSTTSYWVRVSNASGTRQLEHRHDHRDVRPRRRRASPHSRRARRSRLDRRRR